MSTARKSTTTKKREGVIVRTEGQPVAITDSKKMGLKWKADGPMTNAGKVHSASGNEAEETAGVRQASRSRAKERAEEAGTTQRQTAGMGTGRRELLKKPRIQTAVSGPTSRAEPRTKSSKPAAPSRNSRRAS